DGHAERIVLVCGPVETTKPDEAVRLAGGADVDVVATLPIDVIGAAVTDDDVVAPDRLGPDGVKVIASRAIAGAPLDPVVAFVAERELVRFAAEDEVVARTAEGLSHVLTGDDEVLAVAPEDQVAAVAGLDDVVAVAAVNDVVAAGIRDDVVAGAAGNLVVAVAAVEPVIAAVAIDRIVTDAGTDDVIAGGVEGVPRIGAAKDNMVFARVLQVVPNEARRLVVDRHR